MNDQENTSRDAHPKKTQVTDAILVRSPWATCLRSVPMLGRFGAVVRSEEHGQPTSITQIASPPLDDDDGDYLPTDEEMKIALAISRNAEGYVNAHKDGAGSSKEAVRCYAKLAEAIARADAEAIGAAYPGKFRALTCLAPDSEAAAVAIQMITQSIGRATRVEVERLKKFYAEYGYARDIELPFDGMFAAYAPELKSFQQSVLDEVSHGEQAYDAGIKENAEFLGCSERTAEELALLSMFFGNLEERLARIEAELADE
ncbi:hypothetical protein [Methylobacterium soli]|uniref:Uncharacterized protein n=1 Tax=Methylobacterium soli TaxID=553447 RepID=A0A6L3SSP2_9HYPH|nr:hypothetical protein [Methylobacterium soli]KAB1072073.1 hypothetical protein F6X53_28545 [Methylobacterium soli]GJE43759.1 hypothetical protein AEGHOMDF_2938 [Methylobacterium soli]